MDDAEAEAVLRGLGPVLEWIKGEEYASYKATTSKGEYRVGPFATFWGYCAFFHGEISNIRSPVLDNINDVKAACERHHATGRWE